MSQTLINDTKVPVVIDGQTIYVTATEAIKLREKLIAKSITVENPSPYLEYQGKTLICG